MLWYKSWLETRWPFLIGLALLTLSALGSVFTYPQVLKLIPAAGSIDASGELGRRIRESAELARDYRSYVWSQWIRQNLMQMGTLFAVLIGSGSPLSAGASGAPLFTLSLPASRHEVLGIRTATGLGELFVLAFLPPIVVILFSPAIGQSYGLGSALVHSFCLFVAVTTFFSFTVLLSSLLNGLWPPLLIGCAVAAFVGICESVIPALARYGIFSVMSGETFFRTGHLPWLGLAGSVALSAVLFYGAAATIARRDF